MTSKSSKLLPGILSPVWHSRFFCRFHRRASHNRQPLSARSLPPRGKQFYLTAALPHSGKACKSFTPAAACSW